MSRFRALDLADRENDPLDDESPAVPVPPRPRRSGGDRRLVHRRDRSIRTAPESGARPVPLAPRRSGALGPVPAPGWVITSPGARDHECGLVGSGKEAEVHLVERRDPVTGASCLLAAKRYRGVEHRPFRRDAGRLGGQRRGAGRPNAAPPPAGRAAALAERWAAEEFTALCRLWRLGLPVPYPVERVGDELLVEFVGAPDGTAAPPLARLRPEPALLREWWEQLLDILVPLAGHGLAHGELSAYNLLVWEGRLVVIDVPQLVDVVGDPCGLAHLRRDVDSVLSWFRARGLPPEVADPDVVYAELVAAAGLPDRAW